MKIYHELQDIKSIATGIKSDGIAIFPVKNGYMLVGLPGMADKIRKIKKKQNRKCLVHVFNKIPSLKQHIDISKISQENFKFLHSTYHLPCINIIPSISYSEYHDSGETLGVYFVGSNIYESILSNLIDEPLIATSANISGEKTPYKLEDISKDIIDQIDFVFDAGNLPEIEDFCVYNFENKTFYRDGNKFIKSQILALENLSV